MASKESIQPTVNEMRSAADKLMQAAKRLENNHDVLPNEIVKVSTESFLMISRAVAEFTEGVAEAVHAGNELGRVPTDV